MNDFNVKSELLFQEQDFVGHSGDPLTWKIECDALFPTEWKCIAKMIMEHEKRPFQSAIGIPIAARNGLVSFSVIIFAIHFHSVGNRASHSIFQCNSSPECPTKSCS